MNNSPSHLWISQLFIQLETVPALSLPFLHQGKGLRAGELTGRMLEPGMDVIESRPYREGDLRLMNWRLMARTGDAVLTQAQLQAGREAVDGIKMDVALQQYLVRLIAATRTPEQWDANLAGTVMVPASPRATLALAQAACARALIYGRDYATPEDIVTLLPDILRHRLHLSATARAMRLDVDAWVKRLLDVVPIVI